MNQPEPKNHWDSLADELGAKPLEAGPAVPPPPALLPPASPKREYKPAPEVKPAPTDWNSLAAALGLEPAPAPEPQPPRAPVVAESSFAAASEASTKAKPAELGPEDLGPGELAPVARRESAILPEEILSRRIEPTAAEKVLGDLFGRPASSREVAPAEERPARRPEPEFRDDDFDTYDTESDQPTLVSRSEEESLSESDEGEAAPARKRRRRRRGRRGRKETTERGADLELDAIDFGDDDSAHAQGDLAEPVARDEDWLDEAEASSTPGAEGTEEEKTGRKRRRRGRGRRGRRKEGAESSAESAGNATSARDPFDIDDQYELPNDIPLGGGDLDADDDGDRGERSEHRNIPTWDDAISLLIGVNMEARAKSPGGGKPSGPQRGRGRGGRGKRP